MSDSLQLGTRQIWVTVLLLKNKEAASYKHIISSLQTLKQNSIIYRNYVCKYIASKAVDF